MKSRTWILAALLVGGFMYLTSGSRWNPLAAWRASTAGAPTWSGPDVARGAGLSTDELNNIDIYGRAHEATVNITSTIYRRGWFMEMYPTRESGSGFLLDDRGSILTNNHVVSGRSPELQVTLSDRSKYRASVLMRDPVNDLALIRIDLNKKIRHLNLGDSEKLQVGQKVLAIGNPFGLEGTLTTGIISSLGRDIMDENERKLEGMIQTDAAINPGNSGGPLLDSQGNVIGVNTAIYGPGGNIGIGFAMPINRAKSMIEDYRAGRSFGRPRLGVEVIHVSGRLAEQLRLPAEGGLLVQAVVPGSAAEAAGLRGPRQVVVAGNFEIGIGGDLIIAIDGQSVDRSDALSRAMFRKRPGDQLQLTLYRNGNRVNVPVTLGTAPGTM
jgi:S1-C subfamily serine protease